MLLLCCDKDKGDCCWRGKSEKGIFVRLDRGNFGMEGACWGVEREGERLGLT
jgi:hypothetical protein